MSKKRKSAEAKAAHKPIHSLVPDAAHTGEYRDKLNNPDTMQVSTATGNPSRSANPAGGNFWGDPNNMDMTQPGGPV
jgi:hypothetical protein